MTLRANWLADTSSRVDSPDWARFVGTDLLDDVVFDHPDPWPHAPLSGSGQKSITNGNDTLSGAYCTVQGHRFLRADLLVPVRGTPAALCYSCWGSISDETYQAVLAARTGGPAFEGGFAWAANTLPGLETEAPTPCNLRAGAAGRPPQLFAQSGAIFDAQTEGVDFETLTRMTEFG
ncbi:MAG: DUF2199 domain-containing protein [Maritimibacter sp.]